MRKITKLLSVILALCLFATALTGCGSKETAVESSESAAPTKIVVTLLHQVANPVDLQKVQDAVNKITIPEINVEVEFMSMGIFDTFTKYPTAIATGERIDLMYLMFQPISTYVAQGMLEPMDTYIAEYGPTIQALTAERDIYGNANIKGTPYGVGTIMPYEGRGGVYMVKSDLLKEAGFNYESGDHVTLDDLTKVFAGIKEAHPDLYPLATMPGAGDAGYTMTYDFLGHGSATSFSSGALMGLESTTIENVYESDQYLDFLKHMREWYQAGYIVRDAATTDMSKLDYMASGLTAGMFVDNDASFEAQYERNYGCDFTKLVLIDPYLPSGDNGVYWTIPITAQEPAAAMKFLNLMYSDRRIPNLMQFGIEGVHYTLADPQNEPGLIAYPEGLDASNTPYPVSFPIGDARTQLYRESGNGPDIYTQQTATALSRKTQGVGFAYDSANMTNTIIAVEGVISEYTGALETGTADLDTAYPEFISKLKAAGIDDIIADKQAQFDAWLASK